MTWLGQSGHRVVVDAVAAALYRLVNAAKLNGVERKAICARG